MTEESSADTIRRTLSQYDLGRRIRHLRLRKKIALVDLGKHTGLSPSMLSQLENGKMIPTLPTLARIAMVFDVGLDHFFGDKQGSRLFSIVRAGERMRFPERPDMPSPSYFFECLTLATQGRGIQAYMAEFPLSKATAGNEHFHEGSEFIFVVEGVLKIRFQGEDRELNEGDSVLFDPSEPHGYYGAGEKGARAIVVTTPPRF